MLSATRFWPYTERNLSDNYKIPINGEIWTVAMNQIVPFPLIATANILPLISEHRLHRTHNDSHIAPTEGVPAHLSYFIPLSYQYYLGSKNPLLNPLKTFLHLYIAGETARIGS